MDNKDKDDELRQALVMKQQMLAQDKDLQDWSTTELLNYAKILSNKSELERGFLNSLNPNSEV